MKRLNNKVILSASLVAGMGLLFAVNANADSTPQVDTQATATATTTMNTGNMSASEEKALIAPVGNQGQQTLSQIAQANNVSVEVLEKLNEVTDPNVVLTQVYLPQNINYSLLFTSLYKAPTGHSGISSKLYQKYYGSLSKAEREAKLWIAYKESTYRYNATNGKYYGRFQLDKSLLKGNYSVANQERTADKYVKNRYGSWVKAKKFWQAHHWY